MVDKTQQTPSNDASPATGSESAGGSNPAKPTEAAEPKLTTAQELEKEFGQDITPVEDDDTDESGGVDEEEVEGAEDEESSNDDDGDEEDYDDYNPYADESDEGEDSEEADNRSPNQKRIDELTQRRREAERSAAEAARDAKIWRERAIQLGATDDSAEDSEPTPPDETAYDFGQADPRYIADLAKYEMKLEQRTERQQVQFKAQVAELDAKWANQLPEAHKRYPDFKEVVEDGAKAEKWACPPIIAVGIKDSKYGADIAYALAKDPARSIEIANLSPLEQAREFGRMEAQFEAKVSERPKPKIKSSAPPPPKTIVRGKGSKGKTRPDTNDFKAFEALADRILR